MTPEQILQDLRSDRVKKVIMDGDYSAEIDDQYTLAYAYGHEKLEVLGVNAVAEINYAVGELYIFDSGGNTFDIEGGVPGGAIRRVKFTELFAHAEAGASAVIQAD